MHNKFFVKTVCLDTEFRQRHRSKKKIIFDRFIFCGKAVDYKRSDRGDLLYRQDHELRWLAFLLPAALTIGGGFIYVPNTTSSYL